MTSDPFIKRKYQQYISTKVVEKKETFYERMEKDRQRREALLKQNETDKMRNTGQNWVDSNSSNSPLHMRTS